MSPAAGVWEASRRGEHIGRVERLNGRYRARNGRGRELGSFDDLGSACDRVDGGPAVQSGFPRSERAVAVVLWAVIAGGTAIAAGLVLALLRASG